MTFCIEKQSYFNKEANQKLTKLGVQSQKTTKNTLLINKNTIFHENVMHLNRFQIGLEFLQSFYIFRLKSDNFDTLYYAAPLKEHFLCMQFFKSAHNLNENHKTNVFLSKKSFC